MSQITPSYFQANDSEQVTTDSNQRSSISWTALDGPQKNFSVAWYIKTTLFFVAITLAALLWLDSLITTILFVVVYIALIIYVKKPSQKITYQLTNDNLFINDQKYSLNSFSRFGIVKDRDNYAIVLLPTKQIATSLTLNFDKKDGEAIVDFLGSVMPMKTIEENIIDKIIRRLGL